MDARVSQQAPCKENIRISVVGAKAIIIRNPRTNERTAIRAREAPYLAREEDGWIVIPEAGEMGLSRQEWLRHWHDMHVDMEENHDGVWTNYFSDKELYE